jgi:quercetin dioxygenase-like cupin family protein
MIETKYTFSRPETKVIERIIDEEAVAIMHMILPQGDRLPEHDANAHVKMIVAQGTITLQLGEQEGHDYTAGSILAIPYMTHMNVINTHEETVELFVIKAPGPKGMK